MNLGFEYIKYRWKGKRRHGVHSPFIYDLTDKCLRQKITPDPFSTINQLFTRLKKSKREIEIKDFGAGSKKLSKKRRIRDIFQTSSSKGKYGKLLYKIASHYQPNNILEFGTSLGIGSILMKMGYSKSKITTVEACPNTHLEAIQNFKATDVEINAIHSTFSNFLEDINTSTKYDLIFLDGHHDGKATLQYLKQLKEYTHNDTIIILDDIRWSDDMYQMWLSLVDSDEFHVTIDMFRMGIITPRLQQHKEHFTIIL